MGRLSLLLAAGLLMVGPALADAPKNDRHPAKEPVYRSKAPKYGLLVFGLEGRDRVWLVLDADTLYVDRNGNGDLTEPNKKIMARKKPASDPEENGYSFQVGEVTVGGRTHKGLSVYFTRLKVYEGTTLGKRPDVKTALAKDPQALAVSFSVDVDMPGLKGGGLEERVSFMAGPIDLNGVFQFADKPALAPVVSLGGPLEVTFYAELPVLRVGRGSQWELVVGTPGIGPGTFAMMSYEETIPATAKPVADISFPSARPGAPPIRVKHVIESRC